MLQSLVILKSDNIIDDDKVISCLECAYEDDDGAAAYAAHPQEIFLLGLWYTKTGWNSDRKIIHYRAG